MKQFVQFGVKSLNRSHYVNDSSVPTTAPSVSGKFKTC